MLNKRALPGEKYIPQYEDNPLGLPPLDDELTVLAVQPDIELDENRTIKGAALLKNEVMDGWYVIGFTHDSEIMHFRSATEQTLKNLAFRLSKLIRIS